MRCPGYQTSPLFTDAERAALDYATELATDKNVDADTFARLARFYSEREICDIVWLVASEHPNNITNIGLNIGSGGLCELSTIPRTRQASHSTEPLQRSHAGKKAPAASHAAPRCSCNTYTRDLRSLYYWEMYVSPAVVTGLLTLADAAARLAASPSCVVNGEATSHEPPATEGYSSFASVEASPRS
jgi:hypothetical protein